MTFDNLLRKFAGDGPSSEIHAIQEMRATGTFIVDIADQMQKVVEEGGDRAKLTEYAIMYIVHCGMLGELALKVGSEVLVGLMHAKKKGEI